MHVNVRATIIPRVLGNLKVMDTCQAARLV